MVATHCIVVIMSVIILIPTQEFSVTVMMTILLKLVIYQKGVILKRVTKIVMSGSTDVSFVVSIKTSHMKKYIPFSSRIYQHVQNQSYEESN